MSLVPLAGLITSLASLADPAWLDLECFRLVVKDNPLDAASVDVIIPSLCAKGVAVSWDSDSCNNQCFPMP
jgi:hypothetical protein